MLLYAPKNRSSRRPGFIRTATLGRVLLLIYQVRLNSRPITITLLKNVS